MAALPDMETISETNLVFMIGRMNPPTPGHMVAIETVLRLAREEDGIPRIYISSKVNEKVPPYDFLTENPEDKPKIPRGAKALAALDEVASIPMYVKDPRGENPLSADVKKRVIMDMVMNRQEDASWTAGEWTKEQLKEIVVISDDCKGMYKAFGCAERTQRGDAGASDPAKITYVMGKELDPSEAATRDSNCIRGDEEAAFARYKCVQLTRTNDKNGGPESYSGSKIRLLAGCVDPDEEEFVKAYSGYLTEEQARALFKELQSSLCMRDRKRPPPTELFREARADEDDDDEEEEERPRAKRARTRRGGRRNGRRTKRRGKKRTDKRGRRRARSTKRNRKRRTRKN